MNLANCRADAELWWLLRWYAGGLLVLLAATFRLWTHASNFPRLPAFAWALNVPDGASTAALFLLIVGPAVAALATPRRMTWSIVAVGVLIAFALNQHCAQVWAWHLVVAGLIGTYSSPQRALPRLRWLTISIYLWSALSKFDIGFASGPGRILGNGLLTAVHIDPLALPPAFNSIAPWLMPAGELLTAIALLSPRTQRLGLALSMFMHATLLLAVGPLGLKHEAGVQIWNVLFIVQNWLLFKKPGRSSAIQTEAGLFTATGSGQIHDRLAAALLLFVLAMPALQPWNFWDVWPSWAVYSTRGGWTTISVHHDNIPLLPEVARPFVGEPPPLSDWHPVDIDAWSLRELHCPVYPQARFRLGIAAALSEKARIHVERRSAPNRWTGVSTVETVEVLDGRLPETIEREFWLNVTPRAAPRHPR